jgi:hypothetical protein
LLKRSVEMIIQAKVRSKTELLSSDICLAGHDVEQLACLSPHYFADPTTVVHFEPKLKARDGVGSTGEVIPMRKPNLRFQRFSAAFCAISLQVCVGLTLATVS